MTNEHLLTAFLLTLLAGLGTVVGSCIAFMAKRTDHRFLSVTTGFSAGVMLYVSFVEIFPKGEAALLPLLMWWLWAAQWVLRPLPRSCSTHFGSVASSSSGSARWSCM